MTIGTEQVELLSPRAREKRAQVLTAAQKLFLENGFARTSMEAIRLEAGVSKPTLYNYFASKEDLFIAVVHNLMDDFADDWLPAIRGEVTIRNEAELRITLLKLVQNIGAAMLRPDYVNLIRVVIAETPSFPRLGDIFSSSVPTRGMQTVAAILEQARQQGVVVIDDIEASTRMLVGPMIITLVMDGLLISGKPRKPAPERIEALVNEYMKAITP
ncbi:MAG: TetR/AcrR family transcriptional regulator [Chloroflexi bacterium]|nr:MAG: TetR/AcrR family transcriptional regulator [Chloroflexota bacterium]MBL1192940.1 TetR/AcrR family transcriptional regulator [Chloroflexota bacterium]NOH10232.1 TetR/AcrR family transcriptional regulator [Chloroflexota bacterium]